MKLKITLDVEIIPIPGRAADEPSADECPALDVARLISGHIENDLEMWGGSFMWSRVTKASVVSAEWDA